MTVTAQDLSNYDQNTPFGFCTRSSRTNATQTYDCTGGGCYTYRGAYSFSCGRIALDFFSCFV